MLITAHTYEKEAHIILSLIFYVILTIKSGLLQSMYQKIRWMVPGNHYDHFWQCEIFIFHFPPRPKSFTVLDTDQNRSNSANRLSLVAD